MIRFLALLVFAFFSCKRSDALNENQHEYIHVDGRDTARLRLIIYENRFFGELTRRKGTGGIVEGVINGDIKGDTLIGDYHYLPYKAREKKRVPIALLKVGDHYVEGKGQQLEIFGILTYLEHTLKFDHPVRKFMLNE